MCGVIGVIARRDVAGTLVEGLKNLEYRGYDSAGFAVIRDGTGFVVHKEVGRVEKLDQYLDATAGGRIGIAHTRWATHGAPTQINAHPHLSNDGRFAIVHNGIIENYAVLRALLEDKYGVGFVSETDSEVVAQLIAHEARNGVEDPIREAILRLEGTFGLLILDREHPERLIAVRQGSPLLIGIGEGEYYAASDVAAILAHTRQVIYLEDGEIAELTLEGFQTRTFANEPVVRAASQIDWEIESIEKGGYPHFMLKEIMEQPEALRNCFAGRLRPAEGTVRLGGISGLEDDFLRRLCRVIITGCGTAWHAGLVGEYLLEDLARLSVEVEYASELRYRNPVIGYGDLLVAISQSGETADTLAALREARLRGSRIMGICNVVGSTIAREAGMGVYTHAGPEIGVASTKAFVTQVATLSMLAIQWGRLRGVLSRNDASRLAEAIEGIPEQIRQVGEQSDFIRTIAEAYADTNNALYLGRGINFPIALEGALKLKEIAYIHAEGYPAAEMKHGPIALIDQRMPVVVIATEDRIVHDKVLSNIHEIRARKGRVIAIATEGDKTIAEHASHTIFVPRVPPILSPLVNVVPLQLLAYHAAAIRGCEIDKPRNLAKSVTVE